MVESCLAKCQNLPHADRAVRQLEDRPLELIVLGASAGYPGAGKACSGYLVRHEDFSVLVDLGPGVLANAQRYLSLAEIDAVLLSHLHPDHFSDIFVLLTYLSFQGPGRAVPLFGPKDTVGRLGSVAPSTTAGFAKHFQFSPWTDGGEYEVGPFTIRSVATEHIESTFALRISVGAVGDGRSLTYTADTGPSAAVERLARGTDLLLAESSWLERPDDPEVGHLAADDAGRMARECGAGKLVLTHLWPTLDPTAVLARAEPEFGGETVLASEGDRFTID